MSFLTAFKPHSTSKYCLALFTTLILTGCAATSPKFEQATPEASDNLTAQDIFDRTFIRHGGNALSQLTDLNIAINGDWHYLITKIQPLVTDHKYRQRSQERLLVAPRIYSANFQGEAGSKQVFRSKTNIDVAYDGEQTDNPDIKASSALAADAFYLFSMGPLALKDRVTQWQRLEDIQLDGKDYYRINGQLSPGIGLSEIDFISLWVDQTSLLTHRLHITLDGFKTTKGAHVDTTYLAFTQIEGFVFPTHFYERVRGPLKLKAHEWWYTGIDINRGLTPQDITISGWTVTASTNAKSITPPK